MFAFPLPKEDGKWDSAPLPPTAPPQKAPAAWRANSQEPMAPAEVLALGFHGLVKLIYD